MTQKLNRRGFLGALVALPGVCMLARAGLLGDAARAQAVGAAELAAHEVDTLRRFAYLLFPYPDLGPEPYGRVADAIAGAAAADPGLRRMLSAGIAGLDDGGDTDWASLPETDQLAAMRRIEDSDFFRYVLQTTKGTLFNDPAVWALIGYGGSSLEFGGYLDRGLNDIDWLDEGR